MTNAPTDNYFVARGFPWRLYVGDEALERNLEEEVIRAGAKRAFVICSKSITGKTNTVERIKAALRDRFAGVFDGIEIDSTYRSTVAATDAARAAGADLLISVGGGSVIVATRVVDVFLCEKGDPFELMTQYPEGKPAYSPRLMAEKLPIINVVTTPTGAMNRGGSGLANPDLDQRMEYFDPKTRPISLFWDSEALLASPLELFRSTATTTFGGALSGVAQVGMNPLVEGDREQIFRLTKRSFERLVTEPENVQLRIDLCAAAFLGNRADDDGSGRGRGVAAFAGDYAVSTALHVRYPHVWQGESISSVAATVIRTAPTPPIESAERAAIAMGVWRDGMSAKDATLAVADAVEALFRKVGMPTSIRELNVSKEDFESLAAETVKVFNANAGMRDPEMRRRATIDLLTAAW